MAIRPVFVVSTDKKFVKKENIEFKIFNGFSAVQKKRSINNLHYEYLRNNKGKKILEISSKSDNDIGLKLSAFNLMIKTKNGKEFSVESAFQSSKVFENGGPYKDLLYKPSKKSKLDSRLKNSGRIIKFKFNEQFYETEPKTFFYNWLYINALNLHDDLTDELIKFDAFTDIEFNPTKSINCQAEAAAIYVSLRKQNLIKDALANSDSFKKIVYQLDSYEAEQMNFFD